MTEYQYIKSKMNWWDHYGNTWAFVWPVLAFFALIVAGLYVPERDFHLQTPILRNLLLLFLAGFALLIAARTTWSRKQGRLKDEFEQNYTNGGG